jgi:hypothetical protein
MDYLIYEKCFPDFTAAFLFSRAATHGGVTYVNAGENSRPRFQICLFIQ